MKKSFIMMSVFAVLLISACTSGKESRAEHERFPVVNPIVADTIYTNDYVANIQSRQNVEIRARVKGYLENIYVDEGQSVKKGQLLFGISRHEYHEELMKASAELKRAIAEVRRAELELQNVKILLDKNVVSKAEFEMAKAKLEGLNASVEEAKANEAGAALKLSFAEVRAPFDGVMGRIPNKMGSLVDEGTLLSSVSDNKEVFAYFEVSENEYLELIARKNQHKRSEATLVLANNELHKYSGIVETVEGEFDKGTGNIAFRARFSNPDLILRHGSSGKIRLKNEIEGAMIIPQKSTFEIQEKVFVYVVNSNGEVQLRDIKIKMSLPNFYIVESGLSPSDKIIYEGIQRVKEGDVIVTETVSSQVMLAVKSGFED